MKSISATISSMLLVSATVSLLLAACSPYSTSVRPESADASTCDSVLANVVQRHRSGDTAGAINSEMDYLSTHCSEDYDIATGYFSASTSSSSFGAEACDSWLARDIPQEAVDYLRTDGLCTDTAVVDPTMSRWPENGIGWDEARSHAGTTQRVCGPLASLRNTYDGAFVNVGRDYPSQDRFTFIVWDVELKPLPQSSTICGSGVIYLYDGVAQMELSAPEDVEIW